MQTPRMRLMKVVYAYIKEQDPDTPITKYYLTRLIKSGAVPVIAVGRKRYVNLDALLAYLANPAQESKPEPTQSGIRAINL